MELNEEKRICPKAYPRGRFSMCRYGDDVFRAAVRIHAIRDWDGLFEFHVADDEAYIKYYDERAADTGLPPVER